VGVTIFQFFKKYMRWPIAGGCCAKAGSEQRCAEQLLTCLQAGYGWPVVGDSRSGGKQGGLTPVFRAVGHRKGSKQLLNSSAGLVRTVVRNELIVHGRRFSPKNQQSFGVL
jgi:hypothetical protein